MSQQPERVRVVASNRAENGWIPSLFQMPAIDRYLTERFAREYETPLPNYLRLIAGDPRVLSEIAGFAPFDRPEAFTRVLPIVLDRLAATIMGASEFTLADAMYVAIALEAIEAGHLRWTTPIPIGGTIGGVLANAPIDEGRTVAPRMFAGMMLALLPDVPSAVLERATSGSDEVGDYRDCILGSRSATPALWCRVLDRACAAAGAHETTAITEQLLAWSWARGLLHLPAAHQDPTTRDRLEQWVALAEEPSYAAALFSYGEAANAMRTYQRTRAFAADVAVRAFAVRPDWLALATAEQLADLLCEHGTRRTALHDAVVREIATREAPPATAAAAPLRYPGPGR